MKHFASLLQRGAWLGSRILTNAGRSKPSRFHSPTPASLSSSPLSMFLQLRHHPPSPKTSPPPPSRTPPTSFSQPNHGTGASAAPEPQSSPTHIPQHTPWGALLSLSATPLAALLLLAPATPAWAIPCVADVQGGSLINVRRLLTDERVLKGRCTSLSGWQKPKEPTGGDLQRAQ